MFNFSLRYLGCRRLVGVNLRLQRTPQKKSIGIKFRDRGGQFWSPKWEMSRPGKNSCTTTNVSGASGKMTFTFYYTYSNIWQLHFFSIIIGGISKTRKRQPRHWRWFCSQNWHLLFGVQYPFSEVSSLCIVCWQKLLGQWQFVRMQMQILSENTE